MILVNLILGGIIGASLVGIAKIFWPDIHAFMQRVIRKVKEVIGVAVEGAKVLVQKVREGIKEIARTYRKRPDGRWEETTTTKIVPENQVPEDIRAKVAYSEETDISDKYELLLENVG